MRGLTMLGIAAALAAGGGSAALLAAAGRAPAPVLAGDLRPAEAFAGISDPRARSLALFQEAGKVIQHPRCVNCHPRTDRPNQTDRGTPHQPLVVRGADGHGDPALRCTTCHQAENFDPARVPGNAAWAVAPAEMAWEGKSLGQICAQIKDRKRNGGKDMAALIDHMAEDSLVGWAWNPGAGRTPAPGTQAEFGGLIREWANSGAVCPAA